MQTYGMRFDVNCSILFTELPLLQRASAAKAAGFGGVEFWWPWDAMAPCDAEADAFVRAIADAGVKLVSLNFHTGDMAAGERGIVSHPARVAQFRENVAAAVEIAARTGCRRLNAPYGLRVPGIPVAEQDAVAAENLAFAAGAAEKAGAAVLVEAINSVDIPGFPVDTAGKALEVIKRVGAPNVGFLADLYHLAKMRSATIDEKTLCESGLHANLGPENSESQATPAQLPILDANAAQGADAPRRQWGGEPKRLRREGKSWHGQAHLGETGTRHRETGPDRDRRLVTDGRDASAISAGSQREHVSDVLSRHRDAIVHVQVADPPGRGAPGTGTLDFEPLFRQLAAQGYDGWVGLEYLPTDPADSATSFAWLL
jgi:hydroxypyruvate isomerase